MFFRLFVLLSGVQGRVPARGTRRRQGARAGPHEPQRLDRFSTRRVLIRNENQPNHNRKCPCLLSATSEESRTCMFQFRREGPSFLHARYVGGFNSEKNVVLYSLRCVVSVQESRAGHACFGSGKKVVLFSVHPVGGEQDMRNRKFPCFLSAASEESRKCMFVSVGVCGRFWDWRGPRTIGY